MRLLKTCFIVDLILSFFQTTKKDKEGSFSNWTGLAIEQYFKCLSRCIEDGKKLNYIQFYSTPETPVVSAVWHGYRSINNNVFQRHDVTKYGFLFELRESMQCNRPVLFISAYEHEGVVYFSTIWGEKIRETVSGKRKNGNLATSATEMTSENLDTDTKLPTVASSLPADCIQRKKPFRTIKKKLKFTHTKYGKSFCVTKTSAYNAPSSHENKSIGVTKENRKSERIKHKKAAARERREVSLNSASSDQDENIEVKIENVETDTVRVKREVTELDECYGIQTPEVTYYGENYCDHMPEVKMEGDSLISENVNYSLTTSQDQIPYGTTHIHTSATETEIYWNSDNQMLGNSECTERSQKEELGHKCGIEPDATEDIADFDTDTESENETKETRAVNEDRTVKQEMVTEEFLVINTEDNNVVDRFSLHGWF